MEGRMKREGRKYRRKNEEGRKEVWKKNEEGGKEV